MSQGGADQDSADRNPAIGDRTRGPGEAADGTSAVRPIASGTLSSSAAPGSAIRSDPVLTPEPSAVVYQADAMTPGELDALPYGMIQLDTNGVILRYSSAETRLSGLSADACVGRSFFDEVAPCTHVQEFFGRFLQGVQAQQLDAVFSFRFAFVPPKDVRIHMFYSKVTRSVWVKVVALAHEGGGVA